VRTFNLKGKKSIRILVSEECNYACSYCCNELPDIRGSFKELEGEDVAAAVSAYDILVITGGEPLIEENVGTTEDLAELGKDLGKTVIVYTNLSQMPTRFLTKYVDGWTVGYHPSQTDLFTFAANFMKLIAEIKEDIGDSNREVTVRCNVQQGIEEIEVLAAMIGAKYIFPYFLDDCDRSEVEDVYILQPYEGED
jgi:molybdenum cofactor biosynthesis enzyme MoaA